MRASGRLLSRLYVRASEILYNYITRLETIQTLNGNTFLFGLCPEKRRKHDRLQNVEKQQVSGDFPLTEIIIISKVKAGDSCHVAKENAKKIAA